ncbi:MAG: cytochrome c oxidase subunit 3 [Planctomycetaceae bacterium]|nr:cytochrome c oxidase subunit 3 [Planctomycetaceae bacterium]
MSTGLQFPAPQRHASGQSQTAVRFFLLACGAFGFATLLAVGLATLFGRPALRPRFLVPPSFVIATLLLIAGSIALSKAVAAVRREKQRAFRQWLLVALCAGTLFMGVQGYGLYWLLPAHRAAGDASLGATSFVLMLAALHALHLSVAVLFLAFITTRAQANRYDHEYFWGVNVCAWFWHALGIAWLFVLLVLAIATTHGVTV